MRSWPAPTVPSLPGEGIAPRVYDTVGDGIVDTGGRAEAGLYVCGITPYDATHLGHASTYVAFDTLHRCWLDAGLRVRYVQNVTDIDDPLLERAARDGVDWAELAETQTELFRTDMTALRVLPPAAYVGVTERIDGIGRAVAVLLDRGLAYPLPADDADGADVYFDTRAAERATDWSVGGSIGWTRDELLTVSADRGGDPDRAGKRDAIDPLLWRAARDGEPAWESPVGRGRPGWHIECAVIAAEDLDVPMTVQGGGVDLQFPHHVFSDGHVRALTGRPLAEAYVHTALVSYHGSKMSKSLGNLEFVSRLLGTGVDPGAIRLAILAHHYREPWEWTDAVLDEARARFAAWSAAFRPLPTPEEERFPAGLLLDRVRERLAADLDTPGALAAVDEAAEHTVDDPELVRATIDALLGVHLAD